MIRVRSVSPVADPEGAAPAAHPVGMLALTGSGGEPVDLARALRSHGVADLPPNVVEERGQRIATVLRAGGQAWALTLEADGRRRVALTAPSSAAAPRSAVAAELLAQARHMLCLDDDLSSFYAMAETDPALAWVCTGAGRLLRSATVFEDVVKTICTTNCAWSGTVRMVSALVDELGEPAVGLPERHAFPTPETIAAAPAEFFTHRARAGYRGPYLRALATDVVEGRLDLEALRSPGLDDQAVRERLLALAGVGPYAAAHVMMLLGRHGTLVLDSWTRPTYRRLSGRPRVSDKGIVRSFGRYRQFAGLAFWLTLTESWVTQEHLLVTPTTAPSQPGPSDLTATER